MSDDYSGRLLRWYRSRPPVLAYYGRPYEYVVAERYWQNQRPTR